MPRQNSYKLASEENIFSGNKAENTVAETFRPKF